MTLKLPIVLALTLVVSPWAAFGQVGTVGKEKIIENGRATPARSDRERESQPAKPAADVEPSKTPPATGNRAAGGPVALGVRLDKRSTAETAMGWVVEWIAREESFDHWSLLASTRFYRQEKHSPREFAQQMAEQIRSRRDTGDHVANAAVLASEKDDTCAIDFLVSQETPAGRIYEHNVMRFVRVEGGLICQQIARRAYESSDDQPATDGTAPAKVSDVSSEVAGKTPRQTTQRLLWRAPNTTGDPIADLIKSIPQVRARALDDLSKLEITKSPAGR